MKTYFALACVAIACATSACSIHEERTVQPAPSTAAVVAPVPSTVVYSDPAPAPATTTTVYTTR